MVGSTMPGPGSIEMEFRRIFYRNGTHDEIPVDTVLEDGGLLVFLNGAKEILRVASEDVVAMEDR
jgi:hypothetical protein